MGNNVFKILCTMLTRKRLANSLTQVGLHLSEQVDIAVCHFALLTSQDHLDPVFNKSQDVSLYESVDRTSNCFRCYLSNQKLHDNNQKEYLHLFTHILEKLTRSLSCHSLD